MKFSTRISVLLLLIVFMSGLLNLFLIRHQSIELHNASEAVFSETVTQSLSKTIIRDIIDGNTLRVTNQLQKLVSDTNPIVFLFVTKNGRVAAHSFNNGFPKYLMNQDLSQTVSGVKLINKYQVDGELVHEYSSTILRGMDIQLHVGISQTEFVAQLSEVNRNIIFMSLAILIISLLIAYFWSGSFVKPLTSLSKLIEDYGEGKRVMPTKFSGADYEIKKLAGIVHKAIEQRDLAESALVKQANYDLLTELPNRFLTNDRLLQAIKKAGRTDEMIAVFFIDLDDFKKINDSLGHEIGDRLLLDVAGRLQSVVRDEDTIGRQGGDEFIGVFADIKEPADASLIANNIMELFAKPFSVGGSVFNISASIGIATYPLDGRDSVELLKNADLAMYYAKSLGAGNFAFHSKDMSESVQRRIELETLMAKAFAEDEFQVYFQPKYDVQTGEIVGVEALLRWFSAELGFVSPEEFIDVAEQTGFINQLGAFVYKQSVQTLVEINRQLDQPISIAINLSPIQFRNRKLVDDLQMVLDHEAVNANLIELEITENVLLNKNDLVVGLLKRFAESGFHLSMDDFGTGYSSLSYLQKYPFEIIKIDREFIMNLTEASEQGIELVNAIILMAHAMDLKVVAEGVETEQQLAILKRLNCDVAQGFLLSKPIPKQELLTLMDL